MQIIVHDTVKLLQPLFASQLRGRELLERAQSLLYGPDGLVEALRVPIQQKGRGGYDVMQAVQQDGYDALAWIAHQYGIAAYADLVVNVYGSQATVGWERPPVAAPLAADELEYARSVIAEALDTSDPRLITAHLYGDDLVTAQGHTGVGLPPYAGFKVAYRWVRAYLQRAGHDLRQVLAAPTDDILSSKGLS